MRSRVFLKPKEVCFVPWDFAQGMPIVDNLISIRSKEDPKPEFFHMETPGDGYRWEAQTDPEDFDEEVPRTVALTTVTLPVDSHVEPNEEQIKRIIQAVLDCQGQSLWINCKYGQSRSYTVAKWVEKTLNYTIREFHWCAKEHLRTFNHTLDRKLTEVWQNHFAKHYKGVINVQEN